MKVTALYRHPVKSLGEEPVAAVTLTKHRHMPGDRVWAVAHGGSKWDPGNPTWVSRGNFVAQAHVPELTRIGITLDDATGRLTLTHPKAEPVALDPQEPAGAALLTAWLEGIAGDRRPGPYRLARLPDEAALTDVPDAHVSLHGLATLRAVEDAVGAPLHPMRFRGNIWIEGLAPWEEFDLIGREITVGAARLRVTERIARCTAPAANPETGARDHPVTEILRERWGHTDFGVYAQVVGTGRVALGDPVARA